MEGPPPCAWRHDLNCGWIQKLFKFICLCHREGIWRDGAAFFKGG